MSGCRHVSQFIKLQLALTQGNLQTTAHLRKENHEPQDSLIFSGVRKIVHENVQSIFAKRNFKSNYEAI